jgi:hypothetical protein
MKAVLILALLAFPLPTATRFSLKSPNGAAGK